MKIKYSPDVDVLTIELRSGKPFNSCDLNEGIILHLSKSGTPLEIEVLDASRVIQRKKLEISVEGFFASRRGKITLQKLSAVYPPLSAIRRLIA